MWKKGVHTYVLNIVNSEIFLFEITLKKNCELFPYIYESVRQPVGFDKKKFFLYDFTYIRF